MNGLTKKEAARRLKEFGENVLKVKQANPWYKMLFSQFTDLLVLILIVAAGISFFLGEEIDAFVIMGIVILNAGIGFFQEFKTERTLEALKKMVYAEIRVLRDGQEQLLQTEYLVPGDIVILGEGDKIPADGILKVVHSLRIEESALTGESLPIYRKEQEEVFMGTAVVKGSGMLEVVKTGMATKFGEIAKLTTETEKTKSPLQIELGRIGLFVAKVTAVICLGLFVIGIFRGSSFLESLLFSVSVAIAAVPEGLPTTITIALALGATVLARKKAIVKKLSSVETLGAVTTICSDKTGTLTKNEMTVREIYLADRSIYQVSGVGYSPNSGKLNFVGGSPQHKENEVLLKDLLSICQNCNEAKLKEKSGTFIVLGDPTEGSLLTLVQKSDFYSKKLDFVLNLEEIFPFDSDRKMMSVIVPDGKKKKVLVKGSPDQVLEKCKYWSDGKKTFLLTDDKRKKIYGHYERMAHNALRVLAFAEKTIEGVVPKREESAENNLVFVGLVGMIDPPREAVRRAVKNCRTAGIRVIVITGDYGVTAEAIARELEIVKGKNVKVLTGSEVKKISDKVLSKLLKDKELSLIFARSLPEQKMRIVRLLQEKGEIVAMTGDGVNDAPALKKADIGVAMGITGTEVSKEAATMILIDDSFASIVMAVKEGRRIYENLKKFIWFIFACNIGELFVIFAAILFQFPLPLTAILILCVDLGTDILPAIALGVDNPEKGLMKQPPRNISKKLMNKEFVLNFLIMGSAIGMAVTSAFLYTIFNDGWRFGGGFDDDFSHGITVAFVSLVFVQLVNAFSARSTEKSIIQKNLLENNFMIVAVLSSILMVFCIIYIPFLNIVLKTVPLEITDWIVVILATFLPLGVVEIQKSMLRKKRKQLQNV
ncbi:cation-transporting P-type ATPase [Candidatus Gracilibacteria bacterium]|nr:cation-transporting P-type ATPase [Candidatus Gracilibacteria bacterium]